MFFDHLYDTPISLSYQLEVCPKEWRNKLRMSQPSTNAQHMEFQGIQQIYNDQRLENDITTLLQKPL